MTPHITIRLDSLLVDGVDTSRYISPVAPDKEIDRREEMARKSFERGNSDPCACGKVCPMRVRFGPRRVISEEREDGGLVLHCSAVGVCQLCGHVEPRTSTILVDCESREALGL